VGGVSIGETIDWSSRSIFPRMSFQSLLSQLLEIFLSVGTATLGPSLTREDRRKNFRLLGGVSIVETMDWSSRSISLRMLFQSLLSQLLETFQCVCAATLGPSLTREDRSRVGRIGCSSMVSSCFMNSVIFCLSKNFASGTLSCEYLVYYLVYFSAFVVCVFECACAPDWRTKNKEQELENRENRENRKNTLTTHPLFLEVTGFEFTDLMSVTKYSVPA
jgi:hypothetical protein